MLQKEYAALDRQEYALCVMIDLSRVIDTLNRSILLKKKKTWVLWNKMNASQMV